MNDTEIMLRSTIDSLHTKLSDSKSLEEETGIVNEIVVCQEELTKQLFRRSKVQIDVKEHLQNMRDDLATFCLDWAIVSKRAQNTQQSLVAQILRMKVCPDVLSMDAIRLLGYQEKSEGHHGIFERVNDKQPSSIQPSDKAKELGHKVRRLLLEHAYTNENCRAYLKPFVPRTDRLFDGATFTSYRWSIPRDRTLLALDVLVRLFIFGIAVKEKVIARVLGPDALDLLFHQSDVLVAHPVSPSLLISEVQIYPISSSDLKIPISKSQDCFFVTDWSIESLRPTKEAIMSVGYDTLELMSLGGSGQTTSGRLLDVCCGCGIQGIWEVMCSPSSYSELVLSDLNPRACKFACVNLTLNPISTLVQVKQGDLYDNLGELQFQKILSNPPFVALPTDENSAFFAGRGAGSDGTLVLERIIRDAPLTSGGVMHLVTELPNIEDSGDLVKSFCAEPSSMSVAIAYVAKDVETVGEYYRERQAQDYNPSGDEKVDWVGEQQKAGIRNRALALVALQKGASAMSLHKYGVNKKQRRKRKKKIESEDDEDAFLTARGIHFTREKLL